jgi:hypothetical protein
MIKKGKDDGVKVVGWTPGGRTALHFLASFCPQPGPPSSSLFNNALVYSAGRRIHTCSAIDSLPSAANW